MAIGRAGLGRAGPKLAWFFRAKILTAQPALKIRPVGPNSLFKAKKIQVGRAGPGHTGPGHIGPGQIWPSFFRANNLMAQPGPNFGRAGLTHRVGPILPPLSVSVRNRLQICVFSVTVLGILDSYLNADFVLFNQLEFVPCFFHFFVGAMATHQLARAMIKKKLRFRPLRRARKNGESKIGFSLVRVSRWENLSKGQEKPLIIIIIIRGN